MKKEELFNLLSLFAEDFLEADITIDDWDWWISKWIDKNYSIDK